MSHTARYAAATPRMVSPTRSLILEVVSARCPFSNIRKTRRVVKADVMYQRLPTEAVAAARTATATRAKPLGRLTVDHQRGGKCADDDRRDSTDAAASEEVDLRTGDQEARRGCPARMVESHARGDGIDDGRGEAEADAVGEHGLLIGELRLWSLVRGVGGPQHRDKTGVGRAEAQRQQCLRRGLVIVVGQPDCDERSTPTASGMPSCGSRSATTAAGIAYTTPTRACGQDQAMAG
jgi:hypothetical protein